MSEDKELPSPRFELVSKMFDDIDNIFAKYDESDHLSIFEMEILILMIRKKIEHLGIMTALQLDSKPSDKPADVYK